MGSCSRRCGSDFAREDPITMSAATCSDRSSWPCCLGAASRLWRLASGDFNWTGERRISGGPVPVLGQCTSPEHLTICKGTLGTEAAGKLVASLGDPAGLVLLNQEGLDHVSGSRNVEQLALALAQCSAHTHLDWASIKSETTLGRWQRSAGRSVFST